MQDEIKGRKGRSEWAARATVGFFSYFIELADTFKLAISSINDVSCAPKSDFISATFESTMHTFSPAILYRTRGHVTSFTHSLNATPRFPSVVSTSLTLATRSTYNSTTTQVTEVIQSDSMTVEEEGRERTGRTIRRATPTPEACGGY